MIHLLIGLICWVFVGALALLVGNYFHNLISVRNCKCGKQFDEPLNEKTALGKVLTFILAVMIVPIFLPIALVQTIRYKLHKRSCLVGLVKDV